MAQVGKEMVTCFSFGLYCQGFDSYLSSLVSQSLTGHFYKPPIPPQWLLLGHQCSWTLTQANSMLAFNMQSYDCNRKKLCLKQGLNLLCPRNMGVDGGAISGQSYKQFTLVIYDYRVVIWGIFQSGTTLES